MTMVKRIFKKSNLKKYFQNSVFKILFYLCIFKIFLKYFYFKFSKYLFNDFFLYFENTLKKVFCPTLVGRHCAQG